MEKAAILIIDNEKSSLKGILETDANIAVVGVTANIDVAFTMAERQEPALILLNIDLIEEEPFSTAEAFAAEFPSSSLVLMTGTEGKEIFQNAMRIGAKDVINLPVENKDLLKTVNQVLKNDYRRRQLFSMEKKVTPEFKIISVFNTKGGVGKTTVALNLALALRQKTRGRVVLVDLDLYSGNVALMAGIDSRITIKDMIDEINILDKESINDYCVSHKSGLQIIPAPLDPAMAGFVKTEHVEKILRLLSEVFNYVVVDAPTFFSDTLIPALEMSEDILVVSTVDLASGQNLKQCLDLLSRLSMLNKVRLVINRVGYTGPLKIKDLEEQLGLQAQVVIPEVEKAAIDAVNMGEPLLLSAPGSPASNKIKAFAEQLTEGRTKKGFRFGR